MSTVLVTGGSGFLATRCIMQLRAAGHRVHTTVRSATREQALRASLAIANAMPSASESANANASASASASASGDASANSFVSVNATPDLKVFIADLELDAGWPEAVAGCEYVLHVASPFPAGIPNHEDDLITPAREGTLRVLRAARDAGVRRVVLTSSFAAIGYGHSSDAIPFDESVWTNLDGDVSAYVKSKTLAERAAWDFIGAEGLVKAAARGTPTHAIAGEANGHANGAMELSVINPTGIFGPVLTADYASSISLLKQMLDGAVPGCPKLYFGVVDVRDVADLHLRAMTNPAANGERFLAVAGDFLSVTEMAEILKRRMGPAGRRVRTRTLPNWLVRLAGVFNPAVRQTVPDLGKLKNATNEKARQVLGWEPRSAEDALVASAASLVSLGLVEAD